MICFSKNLSLISADKNNLKSQDLNSFIFFGMNTQKISKDLITRATLKKHYPKYYLLKRFWQRIHLANKGMLYPLCEKYRINSK